MDLGLTGRIVVVTGGSKGIGLACAEAFAREGARVAIVSRSAANLDDALVRLRASGIDAASFAADLRDAGVASRLIDDIEKSLGPIDVLVNSAGAARRYPPDELQPSSWHDAMDAKFFSYIHPTDATLKRMVPRGRGNIVNIIGAGGKVASPTHLPGGSANAALMLATTGLAAAFGPRGIRINGINPGVTMTGRVKEGLQAEIRMTGRSEAELLERLEARIPLRRAATVDEVARVAVFLASDAASYVTGAIVPMDGGLSAVI